MSTWDLVATLAFTVWLVLVGARLQSPVLEWYGRRTGADLHRGRRLVRQTHGPVLIALLALFVAVSATSSSGLWWIAVPVALAAAPFAAVFLPPRSPAGWGRIRRALRAAGASDDAAGGVSKVLMVCGAVELILACATLAAILYR